LLHALRRSRNRGERRVRLFEVGARFLPGGPEADAGLCDEVSSFAAVLAGPRDAWLGRGDELDAFDAKGFAEALVEALVRVAPRCDAYPEGARPKHLHPRSAGRVRLGEGAAAVTVGSFGALHPDVIDAFALESSALVLELDLRAIAAFGVVAPKFVPLPAMQATFRDVALEADDGASAASLVEALAAGAGPICARIELFDLYRGKGVTAGRKSMAFRLTYRDPADERTLTDAEVDAAHGAAIKAVANLGATPRG
jgi:phenylalanyl-tRNA synthetase beta chain